MRRGTMFGAGILAVVLTIAINLALIAAVVWVVATVWQHVTG